MSSGMSVQHIVWGVGIFGVLVLSAGVNCAQGYHTYIDNLSSRDLVGTTSYSPGKSAFVNRIIPAGNTGETCAALSSKPNCFELQGSDR